MDFYIDIENASGARQGSGPIISATSFRVTRRVDAAGDFQFEIPATDPQAAEVQHLRFVRCKAFINGAWREVGDGIIESISRRVGSDGRLMLTISGGDRVRELAWRTVGNLKLESGGAAVSQMSAVFNIGLLAPAGWTFGTISSPDDVYARFAGESVLSALILVATKTYCHFYYEGNKILTYDSSFTDSGIAAVAAPSELTSTTCAITDLEILEDSHDVVTRIYPYGGGQGDVRLNLWPGNSTLAPGLLLSGKTYSMSRANNYIECDTATSQYGLISRTVEFKDVAPLSNTDSHLSAAATALKNAAIRWLNQHLAPVETYRLTIAPFGQVLRPMQSIRLIYADVLAGVNINRQLNILETTYEISAAGIHTVGLTVSTGERLPYTDADVIGSSIEQGTIFSAHPQLNANSYVVSYTRPVDQTAVANFLFRFGAEVAQLQQVVFEFQLLSLESTTKSVDVPFTLLIDTGSAGGGTTAAAYDLTSATTDAANATSPHTHTYQKLQSHYHDVSAHTHTVSMNHSHPVTYGVFRESGGNTFALTDLEYRVNGGSWADLSGATSIGSSWYRLDLTSALMNANTYRPNQESNLLEIRRKSAGATGKTGMIDAQLTVRNIIQGIAYS